MKRITSAILSLLLLFSCSVMAFSVDEGSEYTSPLAEIVDILSETGYVLVIDGVPSSITEAEYLELLSTEFHDTTRISETALTPSATNSFTSPQSVIPSYFYKFVPSSSTYAVSSSASRVSPIYVSADVSSISVKSTVTKTRTATYAGGLTISSSIKSAVFSGVEATYSYSTSATSSTSTSVTGTFTPKTAYTYTAIMFKPMIRTISGTLEYYQNAGSTTTLLASYSATAQYPKTVSGSSLLDGVFYAKGSNTTSGF